MAGEDRLGSVPLFLGVETEFWSLAQFQQATIATKALGITSLLVKVADGTDIWYGSIGGWQKVLTTIQQAGLVAIPYTYCYGNVFEAIQSEINILIAIMGATGIVIADMETEYNNQVTWAQTVCAALKPVSGVFGVTTWADPNQQNWQGVLSALAPCTDFFLPQVYSNFLGDVYHAQYAPYNRPYYPMLNLGVDFGANDVLQIARTANKSIIGFWEYQAAVGTYASVVKQVVQQVKGGNATMGVPAGWHYDDQQKILTAPNGTTVRDGFCQWILGHTWDAGNLPRMGAIGLNPVEVGNAALGGGTVQPFNKSVLVWTAATNVYEMFVGKEYIALYQKWNDTALQLKSAQSQIATLQLQIKQLQQSNPSNTVKIGDAVSGIQSTIVALQNVLSDLGQ
jgi:hypothetical protein